MIAYMLRPTGPTADPDSDERVKLTSPDQTKRWLHLVRLLPESIRTYMTMYISACRADIFDRYGEWLFTASSDHGSPVTDHEEEAESSGFDLGWHGAFLDIAKDGTFGTYDDVCHTAIHTICIYMSRKVQEARELQQQYDHQQARMAS
jgi:hypothetical protein